MEDGRPMNGVDYSLLGRGGLARKVYNWDFNVFEVHKQTGGRPLFHVTMALLEDQGLFDGWLLDRAVTERYLSTVESVYKANNPYHNNTHAADVTQTAGVIMRALDQHLQQPPAGATAGNCSSSSSSSPACTCGCFACGSGSSSAAASSSSRAAAGAAAASSSSPSSSAQNNSSGGSCAGGLSKLERFAVIIASAVHDLGHPGVNNLFLVRTRAPTAVTYNDRSVNENMHACLAFQYALADPELNIFANFSTEEYELLRKYVLEMVLSTDMDVHFTLLKRFEDALGAAPDVRTWASPEQRSLLFQMLVHLADLANPSRPWHLALQWAEWVVTEFLSQGEKEAAAGIPVTPPCDASKVCMPAAQLFFIERFMAPTLEAFRSSAPAFYAMAAAWLADTQAKWGVFKAAGVKFPHQGYPQLPPAPADQPHLPTTLGIGGCGVCCCGDACQPVAAPQQQQPCKLTGEQQPQQQAPPQPAAQAVG